MNSYLGDGIFESLYLSNDKKEAINNPITGDTKPEENKQANMENNNKVNGEGLTSM